jgi:hypothetical protein
LPLLYAYPNLSVIPPVEAGQVPDTIYAFRVDVTDQQNGPEFPDRDRYVFREILVSETGRVPSQAKFDVDRGWVFYGPLTYSAHTRHVVLVRLYRPGWQTIEVAERGQARPWQWVEALDLNARENAVDDLLSTWKTDASGQAEHYSKSRPGGGAPRSPEDATLFRCLAPGSAGAEHRRVLLFAAAEYERIAGAVVHGSAEGRCFDRLMAKVQWLRKRADE